MNNAEYVGAICASREKYILTTATLEKLLTLSLQDALKQIKESGFGKGEDDLDAEKLIVAEEENFINFIKEFTPSESFFKYKLLKFDYHNAQSILRAVNLGLDASKMLMRSGNFDVETLTAYIENGEKDIESEYLKQAIIEGKKLFLSKKATGVKLDILFLKAMYQESLALTKKIKSLNEFVKVEIDGANVQTALRCANVTDVTDYYIEGGNIALQDILKLAETKTVADSLKQHGLYTAILSAITAVKEGKALVEFENAVQSYALQTLVKRKYEVAGYDLFYLYCAYKENEIRNVRVLTVGLSAGLDKAEIKARFRLNYAR